MLEWGEPGEGGETAGPMKTVNAYYLYRALGPLNAISDSESEAVVDDWDESSPTKYQEFLARYFMPSYDQWDVESQRNVLDALQYALATGRIDFAAVLADQWYSPMPCPDNPREVFEVLWQLLAPGRSYQADDIATWQEDNIPEEAVIRLGREQVVQNPPKAQRDFD